ncbi:hypothetical protein [Bifidobacterium rousetti]|uniref:hypothetical protein n=1 Tax=Bifidobacterium rousetti TaxID=2045439 RepID=UPI00123AF56D|nr:hypothetical protein [Bifidobacterium rousetti]
MTTTDTDVQPRWRLLIPDPAHHSEGEIIAEFTPGQIDRTILTLWDYAKLYGPIWLSYEEEGELDPHDLRPALEIAKNRIPDAIDQDEHDGLTLLSNALNTAIDRRTSLAFELDEQPDITRPTPAKPTGDRRILVITPKDVDDILEQPGALWTLTHHIIPDYDMAVIHTHTTNTPLDDMEHYRAELIKDIILAHNTWAETTTQTN